MRSLRIAIAPTVAVRQPVERVREIAPHAEVRVFPNAAALDGHLDWVQVVFGMISPDQILRAPNLEWVQLNSSGFDPYLKLSDVPVKITTARGVASAAAAEYVIGAMLLFTRLFPLFEQQQRERRWYRNIPAIKSLVNQTLGIVGFGANGNALAQRAKAMQMRGASCKANIFPRAALLCRFAMDYGSFRRFACRKRSCRRYGSTDN